VRRRVRSPVQIGLIALVLIAVGTYLGFTKDIPFTRGFEIKAVFESANGLKDGSAVRIAGVNVGKVKGIARQQGGDAAVVTMEISDDGLPLHEDATAKIRPRIFLEGNFFVDLKPGTPEKPTLDDGDTIMITQTARPVQLDEVLTSLQSDSRDDLRDVLRALGTALSGRPSEADDAQADPSARGETAAQSWNDAYDDSPGAFRSAARVNRALLGSQPGSDLPRLISGTARTTGALIRNEVQLKDLVSNVNDTMGALASEQGNLSASIRELSPTLEQANGTLTALNESFPPTRAFAREILPGVRETAATIDAAFPWIEQTRRLVSRPELGGLVRDLAPAAGYLARLTDASTDLLRQADLAARCAKDVLLPTGNVPLRDEFPTGVENYKEFFYALVGLSGEGQNFDGNGYYVRFQTGGGSPTVSLGSGPSRMVGNAALPPLGVRPKRPARPPAYRPEVPCHTQQRPDLNGPAAARVPGESATARATRARTKAEREAALSAVRKKLRPWGEGE
jgi:phospholipid/cholesterol/gamma-HCH transport system substrate-binding protein